MFGWVRCWYRREHEGLGVPFPPISRAVRAPRGNLCRSASRCGATTTDPYDGKYYQLAGSGLAANRFRRPDKKIPHRRRRREEDASSLSHGYERRVQHLFALRRRTKVGAQAQHVLKAHCEAEGRDYNSIKKTMNGAGNPLSDIDGFLREMERYAALGISLVDLRNVPPDPASFVSELGDKSAAAVEPDRPELIGGVAASLYSVCIQLDRHGGGRWFGPHPKSVSIAPLHRDSTPRSSLDEHTTTRYQPGGSPFAAGTSGAVQPMTSSEPEARLSDVSTRQ